MGMGWVGRWEEEEKKRWTGDRVRHWESLYKNITLQLKPNRPPKKEPRGKWPSQKGTNSGKKRKNLSSR